MNTLRWILGIIAVGFAGGFVFLAILSNMFRRSFGASEHGPLFFILPVVGFALLLGSIFFPAVRPLLHLSAVAAGALLVSCLWGIFTHGEISFWVVVAYLGLWFVYYRQALELSN